MAEAHDAGSLEQGRARVERSARVTELRLAVVCYGGVSLAIYMHGVTKELHKLVVASRFFDDLGVEAVNPFDPATQTEHAYFEALRSLALEGHRLTVTIDIIAGTSAGGINGVCLAKVLARGGSQEALKRLWIDEGDLRKLLHSPRLGGWRTRAALAAGRTLAGLRRPIAPLRGAYMSCLLYDAIAEMDEPMYPKRRSLLVPATPLDLFVTTTDLEGSAVLVPSGSGGISQRETDHAQVLHFRADGTTDSFGPEAVGALAFAARATASFPGAFAPVSLHSFRQELGTRPMDSMRVERALRRRHSEQPTTTWFVDGGLLDNAPFDLVLEAIGQKRAQSEVVRRLVYIQPDPGARLTLLDDGEGSRVADAPGYLSALLRSVVTIKGSHSILRDLESLRDLNLRIAEIGSIAAHQMDHVSGAVERAWIDLAEPETASGGSSQQAWSVQDPEAVKRLGDRLYATTPLFVGASFSAYCRLKVESAGRRLADEVVARFVYPPRSSRSSFIRAAISAWARGRVEWRQPDSTRLIELLGPVDVPYRERRLMFILAGINQLYVEADEGKFPRRSQLDALKDRVWQLLDDLREAPREAVIAVPESAIAFLGADLADEAVFGNPEAFGAANDDAFARLFTAYRDALADRLADSSLPIWQAFLEHTQGWDDGVRRRLMSRYLGFPLWDALIFPTVALAELPQFTPIPVSQFSPLTAMALPTPDGGKLKGVTLHHFGGFIDPTWRENDYLWGRLDTAELILRMLRSATSNWRETTPTTPQQAAWQAGPHLSPALRAVLASEDDLRRDPTLIPRIDAQISALSDRRPEGPGPGQSENAPTGEPRCVNGG